MHVAHGANSSRVRTRKCRTMKQMDPGHNQEMKLEFYEFDPKDHSSYLTLWNTSL